MEYSKKFISLDVETTHLDMKEGRIMEFGAVRLELLFDTKKKRIKAKLGKTFTTLINPEVEPSDTALAITGISKRELDQAPVWNEVKDKIKNFIGNDVILGHNINFDLGYLRNQGLDITNLFCDSLELAQTLLPLSSNHNLEYLTDKYKVQTGSPHRALVDSIHTGMLVGEILNDFFVLPPGLQVRLKDIIRKSQLCFRDVILDLPELEIPAPLWQMPLDFEKVDDLKKFAWSDGALLTMPLLFNRDRDFFHSLQDLEFSGVVATLSTRYFKDLPSQQILSEPDLSLCLLRFHEFAERADLGDLGSKVLIKILIGKTIHNNLNLGDIRWTFEERDILLLLNTTRETCLVHGCEYVKLLSLTDEKIYFTSLRNIFEVVQGWGMMFKHSKLLLVDLVAVEDEFTEQNIQSWNLKKARLLLETFYPLKPSRPAILFILPAEVKVFADDLDLFFGVLHLIYLKREGEYSQNLLIDDQEMASERFRRVCGSADKFLQKLIAFHKFLNNQKLLNDEKLSLEFDLIMARLVDFGNFLEEYFLKPKLSQIYWLEFGARSVNLHIQPKAISELFKNFTSNFRSVTMVSRQTPKESLAYYQHRLGLDSLASTELWPEQSFKKILVHVSATTPSLVRFAKSLDRLSGRVVCVFPNETKLKEAWPGLTQNKVRPVFAHKLSGSFSSVKNKFHADETNSAILCLTNHAFFRYWPELPRSDHLLIFRLPFEVKDSKPSLLGIDSTRAFKEHILPRAIYSLHLMLSRFLASGSTNPQVWFFDKRITEDYDHAFMNYLKEFSNFTVELSDWDENL